MSESKALAAMNRSSQYGNTAAFRKLFSAKIFHTATDNNKTQNIKIITSQFVWETSTSLNEGYNISCSAPYPDDFAYLALAQKDGKHYLAFHRDKGYLGKFDSVASLHSTSTTRVISGTYLFAYRGASVCIFEDGLQVGCYNKSQIEYSHQTSASSVYFIIWLPETFEMFREYGPDIFGRDEDTRHYRMKGYCSLGFPVTRYRRQYVWTGQFLDRYQEPLTDWNEVFRIDFKNDYAIRSTDVEPRTIGGIQHAGCTAYSTIWYAVCGKNLLEDREIAIEGATIRVYGVPTDSPLGTAPKFLGSFSSSPDRFTTISETRTVCLMIGGSVGYL